ncbi:MAG TPA: hypothetical protein VGE69_06450 [Pseudomonadales bacterium]
MSDEKRPAREYEKSGCYPEGGKPFRVWALLGGLMLVIALLAGAAALLNVLLLPESIG